MGEELQTVVDMLAENCIRDVVVDFADVDIVTSSSIAKLLKLRKMLTNNGQQLVFSSADGRIRQVFTITGLDSVFEFVDDQFVALAGLQLVS